MSQQQRLLTVDELVSYLQSKNIRASRTTIYRYIKNNELPYIKVGGQTRFNAKDVDNWIDKK